MTRKCGIELLVLRDIEAERARQLAAFSLRHDDEHTTDEFLHLCGEFVDRGLSASSEWGKRGRLVQVAALAVAAVEAWDRGDKRGAR